jgi:hypothetical protein
MRASYTQVLADWATIQDQILALVRAREHVWHDRSRKLGHSR